MGICRQPCLFTWGASSMVHFACIWECIQIPDAKLFTSQKWREWMQNHECLDPPKKKKLVLTHPHVGLLENRVPQSPTVYHNLQVSHRWLQYIPFPPKKCVWLFKKKDRSCLASKALAKDAWSLFPQFSPETDKYVSPTWICFRNTKKMKEMPLIDAPVVVDFPLDE